MENGQPEITNEQRISRKQISFVSKKVRKKSSIRKRYNETINQYISKGYARRLTQNEIRNTWSITNFIPHHCILNPKKADKVRAVFDAGPKFKGISHKSDLLKGPNPLNSLTGLLIHFKSPVYWRNP